MDLGPLGPVKNLDTGSDTPAWAHVSAWTVARWEQVLRYRPDLVPLNHEGDVDLPGVDGAIRAHQIAALVHRTVKDPDAGRWRAWTFLFGWLDPVARRQARVGWLVRVRVQAEVDRILTRRATRSKVLGIEETYDPFVPFPVPPPPTPNAPRPRNKPAPPA